MTLGESLIRIQESWPYLAMLFVVASFPVVSGVVWISTSLMFFFRWERHASRDVYHAGNHPLVSVVVPAYGEEDAIASTIEGLLRIDYPFKEIVIVDDASTDDTVAAVLPFVKRGQVRLVRKVVNEGRAMAVNDALPLINGEIVLIMDAGAYPDPTLLRWIVPHFSSARVAAVMGNLRVSNRNTLLAKLQLMETASVIGLVKRTHRVWGRCLTMTGVVAAFRKSALIDVGGYSPEMAAPDIDMTWKLQRKFYDIRFEPRALIWTQVSSTLGGLLRQRIRQTAGLAQVFKRNQDILRHWRYRRHWPVVIEAGTSVFWAYCAGILSAFWVVSYVAGSSPFEMPIVPGWLWVVIGATCFGQLLVGVLLDRRYDKQVPNYYYVAVFYPVLYWMSMMVVTLIAIPMGMTSRIEPGTVSRWRPTHEPVSSAPVSRRPAA